jgi:hypothetical protein
VVEKERSNLMTRFALGAPLAWVRRSHVNYVSNSKRGQPFSTIIKYTIYYCIVPITCRFKEQSMIQFYIVYRSFCFVPYLETYTTKSINELLR